MQNITFVCTGNTCRSAMAEGLFKKMLEERGITDITCRSCGLAAYTGDEASPQAVEVCRERGVDLSTHRATVFNRYIFDETDIMVCMTENHKGAVMRLNPTFRVIVPDGGVPDPYGGNVEIYRNCADSLEAFLNRFLDSITMDIAPMCEEHIPQIAELEKVSFSVPWSEDGLRSELANDTAHFLVASCENKVLGYIGVHEICGEAYITNVAVLPEYRRLGIGETLIDAATNGAKERNCDFISLEVRISNVPAIELYKKEGYNIVGQRKNFYSNPTEDAYIMTRYLKEVDTQ
ncbi:MAG: ribosomal protein S18-alanine N-acetyltransferase [Clostridia bacterium]|nr:ribosomal protein S18-alanine N-acetyltransferase [Clostridia bacterium]